MTHRVFPKDPIKFLCIVVSIACTFILCLSVLKLHQIPVENRSRPNSLKLKTDQIGKLGEMVIDMLPEDLGFTLFLPSETAFKRDLGLSSSDLVREKENDTYVILTRVLGFSAVPRTIYSDDVVQEIDYDSISGYTLYISKDFKDGSLIVNRIAALKMVDLREKGRNVVVHIMDGVIMDPEFEQSVQPEDDSAP